jgi:hypothetical protein
MTWLQNVIDRAACGLIVEQGGPLYHADLATHIQQHFQDVLASLNQEDEEQDDDDGMDVDSE